MEVIEESKNKIIFTWDCNHGFANLFVDELWNDKDIFAAAYEVDHPQIGKPKFVVETKKEDVRKAISSALVRMKKQNNAFLKQVSKLKF
jgi:DNA-directed RNA polymerase subunit L